MYGLPEAASPWHSTYSTLLSKVLLLKKTSIDPCLFFPRDKRFQGMVALHVDDTLCVGNDEFMKIERGVEKRFESNPVKYLPFTFAGVNYHREPDGVVVCDQKD
uniref:Reverse transcriptase Ty1/copia-type domain-containing protein n=1 Tax=Rhodosorus marinus TaxID=101924 RepID=A0A7S0BT89_9RHOD|mmetsp:Transcript_7562/g.11268  ORF Transcript_7562/g.11268 Transcript_7562/m.11268 type:complete len:104 (+) Transcript_7562:571-882(+)